MKVLFSNDAPLIKYGLKAGFDELGHNTKFIGLWNVNQDQQGDYLNCAIDEFMPDVVLAEGHSVGVKPETFFTTLAQRKVPLVYWAIEDPILFSSVSTQYARHSVLTLTTARSVSLGTAPWASMQTPFYLAATRPFTVLSHLLTI